MRMYVRLGLLLAAVLALTVLADGGTPAYAWGDPAALNTNAPTDSGDDFCPQVTSDGAGNWVAVWHSYDSLGDTIDTDGDILVARSTDNGTTWTAPVALNTNAATDAGGDYYPEVTTDGAGNWVAVWFSDDSLGGSVGTDGDIRVSRSTDNGVTWTDPAVLNSNAASDSGMDFYPQVTTDRGGNWVAIWESSENLGGAIGTDRDILVSRSTDNAATWTAPAALNSNAATDSGEDYWPRVTTDGGGNWVAVWRSGGGDLGDTIGTDNDILVARSTDNGATWTAPAALNSNAATDSRGDYFPQVTTDGAGNWVAVWTSDDSLGDTIGTDGDILVARSTTDSSWPWTWTEPAALNTNATADSGGDWHPQVTTDGAGNWVAAWDSYDSLGGAIATDYDILVARSTDKGATWTAPTALNTNATADSGEDWYPQVTTDGAANWVAVWNSDDSLGGAIATDYDILYATMVIALADDDGDGVAGDVEDGAPNGGDGNNDGTLDSLQGNVASLPNVVDGGYVTLVSPDATSLADVAAVDNPSPGDAPPGVDFPIGFFEFQVQGIAPGGSTTVTLLTSPGVPVSTYYKFGPTPDNPLDHWYEFLFDGTTGAEIGGSTITLHFVDGQRGDDNLTEDGAIEEPGAPGLPSSGNGPVGGIVELRSAGTNLSAHESDSSAPNYIALATLAAAALVALGAGGWYARRRRVR